MSVKGKTYEEIFGLEKAAKLKAIRRNNTISQMKVQRKGKTHTEIYGKKRAKNISKKQSKANSGKNNPNYQGGKVIINCYNCNKSIEVFKGKKDTTKYCSYKCRDIAISKQIEYKCIVCNVEFSRKESWGESKYCSMKCRNKDYKGANNPNWKDGISFESYNIDWTKKLRLYIRTRDNFICQLCNMTEIESLVEMGRILTVHHIDYDKQNCNESNLITTCTKCNTKVNGNRDYWTSYFNNKIGELV